MATDEMIWADVEDNFCILEDGNGKEILKCSHYVGMHGYRVCSARKENMHVDPHEYPCENRPRILVNKREYITWKLTR